MTHAERSAEIERLTRAVAAADTIDEIQKQVFDLADAVGGAETEMDSAPIDYAAIESALIEARVRIAGPTPVPWAFVGFGVFPRLRGMDPNRAPEIMAYNGRRMLVGYGIGYCTVVKYSELLDALDNNVLPAVYVLEILEGAAEQQGHNPAAITRGAAQRRNAAAAISATSPRRKVN